MTKKQEPTRKEIVESIGSSVLALLIATGIDEMTTEFETKDGRVLKISLQTTEK